MSISDARIRFAEYEDIPKLITFLQGHAFQENNLLSNMEYFKYYFVLCDGGHINFAIAQDDSGEIFGACGYVRSARSERFGIWTTLWGINKNTYGIHGIDLKRFVIEQSGASYAACNNITAITQSIYHRLGYITGKMKHYYRIADKEQYAFLDITDKRIETVTPNSYRLIPLTGLDELKERFALCDLHLRNPVKDWWYVERRYITYPWYQYNFYGIERPDGFVSAVLIGRIITHEGRKMIRLVDCLGVVEDLSYVGWELQKLMDDHDYEFIEFYCAGVDQQIMKLAGFSLTDEGDVNIISSYLEPLKMISRDFYFYSTAKDNFMIFRADGDYDRKMFF